MNRLYRNPTILLMSSLLLCNNDWVYSFNLVLLNKFISTCTNFNGSKGKNCWKTDSRIQKIKCLKKTFLWPNTKICAVKIIISDLEIFSFFFCVWGMLQSYLKFLNKHPKELFPKSLVLNWVVKYETKSFLRERTLAVEIWGE